jgi:hypothetical protein
MLNIDLSERALVAGVADDAGLPAIAKPSEAGDRAWARGPRR